MRKPKHEHEECMKCTCGKGSCIDCGRKEQPTTLEKRLKYIDEVGEVTDEMLKFLEKRKLPTSSYEVTCGRCEKSIKHSCGRV